MAFQDWLKSFTGQVKPFDANQAQGGPAKYDASAVPFVAAGAHKPALQQLDRGSGGQGQRVSEADAKAFFAAVARQMPEAESGLVRIGDLKSNPTGLTRLEDVQSAPVMMHAAGKK